MVPWDRLGELWREPGRWRPLAVCLGGGRAGIIFLLPPIWPLCQQIVLIFHMEGSRDPLESSNSRPPPCRQQQSSMPHAAEKPYFTGKSQGNELLSISHKSSCTNWGISSRFYTGPCGFERSKTSTEKLGFGGCIFCCFTRRRPGGNRWDGFKAECFQFSFCNSILFQNLCAVNYQKAAKQKHKNLSGFLQVFA